MNKDFIKNVMITGANGGIGFSLTKALLDLNHSVVAIDKKIDKLVGIQHNYENLKIKKIDLVNFNELEEKFHPKNNNTLDLGIDLLILSSGIIQSGTSNLSPYQINDLIENNIMASVNIINLVIDGMKQSKKGQIITFTSKSAINPTASYGGYALSKAGLHAYMNSLYKELSEYGVKVTSICPGVIDTEMTKCFDIENSRKIQISDIVTVVVMLMSLGSEVSIREVELDCTDMILNPTL